MMRLVEAQPEKDVVLLISANWGMAIITGAFGELEQSRNYWEQILSLYNTDEHRSLALVLSQDPKMAAHAWLGMLLPVLGYPDQAVHHIQAGVEWAQELDHTLSLAFAIISGSQGYYSRRDILLTQESMERGISIALDGGFVNWLPWGTVFRAWALMKQGHGQQEVIKIDQAIATLRQDFAYWFMIIGSLPTLEVYKHFGQYQQAHALINEVIKLTGSKYHFHVPKIHRLKGELLLLQGADDSEVEQHLQKAIEIAHYQKAKLYELRATVSLARLWQSQGKQTEAHTMLSEIYNWFTEGFDTVDLKEAKALLDELS
jgi:tetratricopeptide (TPR) repeat protein